MLVLIEEQSADIRIHTPDQEGIIPIPIAGHRDNILTHIDQGQIGAACEGLFAHSGNAVGDHDLGQRGTLIKRISADGCNAVGQDQVRQTAAA